MTKPNETAASGATYALCFSGHIMRASDGSVDELARAESMLADYFRVWLSRHRLTSVHTSLAAGADIIFAEQALAGAVPLHITLPFRVADFCRVSVEIGNGGHTDWVPRYYACLERAIAPTEIWPHELEGIDLNPHFAGTNRHLARETIEHARLVGAEPLMLAVVARNATGKGSFAVETLDQFGSLGLPVDTIEWPLQRNISPTGERYAR